MESGRPVSVENLVVEQLDVWAAAVRRRSAAGRGASGRFELYGIKKLRELILELAVRGVLVPQDAGDEPASVLLKRIAAEKARLVKEGKIKKEKELPPFSNQQQNIELPNGWSCARLGELFSIVYGKGLSNNELTEGGYPVFGANGIIGCYDKYLYESPQLLISCRGAYSGKPNISPEKCFVTSNSLVLENEWNFLSLQYFYYALTIADKRMIVTGSAQPQVTTTNLEPFVVNVPPLAEQHRIVAKVDELMALCDQLEQHTESSLTAHQTLVETLLGALTGAADHAQFALAWQRLADHFDILFTTEDSIDQLKQAILQLAVMGKLVPQDPNDEPAAVLLKKIAAEKARLVKEGKIKKEKALPPVAEEEKPFAVPEGWEWVRFGKITNTRLGKMLDNAKNKGLELPYLRNTNVQWHRFDLSDIKLMRIGEDEKEDLILMDGDLLICEGGEPGRCAIWRCQSEEMYFQKALHRARPFGGVISDYLQLCLTVDAYNGYLDRYFTGATIKHFVGSKLDQYTISLPPSAEQHRIVTKVDELMALCDQLKARLTAAQATRVKLADAVAAGVLL